MSQNNKKTNKAKPAKKKLRGLYIVAGILIVAVAAITFMKGSFGAGSAGSSSANYSANTSATSSANPSANTAVQKGGDLLYFQKINF